MTTELIAPEAVAQEQARRVRAAINDPYFPALARLEVTVADGVAELRGRVASAFERRVATNRARRVPGIRLVRDLTEIDSPTHRAQLSRLRAAAASGIELALAVVSFAVASGLH